MNAQDQIKQRARIAIAEFMRQDAQLEDVMLRALTAQQTADAAAHREEVERLEDRIEKLEQQEELVEASIPGGEFEGSEDTNGKIVATIVSQRDTARAESAKLREVLWKTLEAAAKACDENAERLAEDMDFRNKDHSKWWKRVQEMRETIRLTVQLLRESKQDAIAATVLKEWK